MSVSISHCSVSIKIPWRHACFAQCGRANIQFQRRAISIVSSTIQWLPGSNCNVTKSEKTDHCNLQNVSRCSLSLPCFPPIFKVWALYYSHLSKSTQRRRESTKPLDRLIRLNLCICEIYHQIKCKLENLKNHSAALSLLKLLTYTTALLNPYVSAFLDNTAINKVVSAFNPTRTSLLAPFLHIIPCRFAFQTPNCCRNVLYARHCLDLFYRCCLILWGGADSCIAKKSRKDFTVIKCRQVVLQVYGTLNLNFILVPDLRYLDIKADSAIAIFPQALPARQQRYSYATSSYKCVLYVCKAVSVQ